jgi:tetratricopeptide (TPR) repeat protein
MDSTRLFTTLKYSRLLDDDTAIAILDDVREEPLLDLEILRREIDSLPSTRATAEVWLLLNRHPSSEAVHEWAAWYFDLKKLYNETDRLLLEASRKGMDGTWYNLHRGLAFIREGKTDAGEKILKEATQANKNPDWRIFANLGRIYESRRAISTALEYYESAAALVSESKFPSENRFLLDRAAAAQVQMRLSRCLGALGRTEESLRALEYAYELDPDNMNIRRELRRVNNG